MKQERVDAVVEHDKTDGRVKEVPTYFEYSSKDYGYRLDVLPNGQPCMRRYDLKKLHDSKCCR